MSYNIDTCKTLRSTLTLSRENYQKIISEMYRDLPESSFINNLNDIYRPFKYMISIYPPQPPEKVPEIPEKINIDRLNWCGEGSGYTFETLLLQKIVPLLEGSGEVVFVWEGGDYLSGLQIDNGSYQECHVGYVLTPKVKIERLRD